MWERKLNSRSCGVIELDKRNVLLDGLHCGYDADARDTGEYLLVWFTDLLINNICYLKVNIWW